ncbi:hypothetical protein ZHAS_00013794 [Anopheles sinensis]|uniref:Uncharacterized protein n=1 Tax=Anopheles sinensis TaxID=74873 RepID=A0A084W6H0_ANOSI|nr:hypothetical protein ZHAS_00013794 [Anopheles sinensis]
MKEVQSDLASFMRLPWRNFGSQRTRDLAAVRFARDCFLLSFTWKVPGTLHSGLGAKVAATRSRDPGWLILSSSAFSARTISARTHLVHRDLFLLTVCVGLVLSTDVGKDTPDDLEPTSPTLDDGVVMGNLTDTSTTTTPASTESTTRVSDQPFSSTTPHPPLPLARANTTPSGSASTKSISTGPVTTGTTSKPSAKRQISLNEFQQLVAKVNDEIGMLRNQSANLSQTYDELVRRYNERTSQIPIVLYDVTDCSNGSKIANEDQTATSRNEDESIVQMDVERTSNSTESEEINKKIETSTAITTESTASTRTSTISEQHLSSPSETIVERRPQVVQAPEIVPQNPSNGQTQIYGNKYYNYVHYFMYPPSEEQLKEVLRPVIPNNRQKEGDFSEKVDAIRRRHGGYSFEQDYNESLEEENTGNGPLPVNARWRLPPNFGSPSNDRERPGMMRNSLRVDPLDYRPPYDSQPPAYPYDSSYRWRNNGSPIIPSEGTRVRPFVETNQRTEVRPPPRNPFRGDLPLGRPSRPDSKEKFGAPKDLPKLPKPPTAPIPASPERASFDKLDAFSSDGGR